MTRLPSSSARACWCAALVAVELSAGCAGPRKNPESQNAPAFSEERKIKTQPKAPSIDGPMAPHSMATSPGQAAEARERPWEHQDIELLSPPADHPWLGVELQATEPTQPGVRVQRVVPGSPAERAELRAGDVIVEIDGQPTTSPQQLSETVKSQTVNDEVPVLFDRGGQMHLLRITLSAMPEFEDRLRLAFIGRPAPEIEGVMTFQGDAASLRDFRGDVLVLEFWASFCGVCRMMGPLLDRWDQRYRALGARVMGITVDPPDVATRVARQAQMQYTLASDPDSKITREYWASQIPTLFIIDREGVVQDVMVGYFEPRLEQIESLIERLLEQPGP